MAFFHHVDHIVHNFLERLDLLRLIQIFLLEGFSRAAYRLLGKLHQHSELADGKGRKGCAAFFHDFCALGNIHGVIADTLEFREHLCILLEYPRKRPRSRMW